MKNHQVVAHFCFGEYRRRRLCCQILPSSWRQRLTWVDTSYTPGPDGFPDDDAEDAGVVVALPGESDGEAPLLTPRPKVAVAVRQEHELQVGGAGGGLGLHSLDEPFLEDQPH
jgi:hypothetical protein